MRYVPYADIVKNPPLLYIGIVNFFVPNNSRFSSTFLQCRQIIFPVILMQYIFSNIVNFFLLEIFFFLSFSNIVNGKYTRLYYGLQILYSLCCDIVKSFLQQSKFN